VHELRGYNSRLDPIQAAVLSVKLAHLDDWNERRRRIATRYLGALAASGLQLPAVPEWAEPVWHLFVVRHPQRDALQKALADAGVGTLIHYPVAPHRQAAFADMAGRSLPISEQMHAEVLSLPIGPQMTDAQRDRVIEAVSAATARDASASRLTRAA